MVAVVLLWVLLVAVALAVVALARQVGLLHLRINPLGPGPVAEGPPVGKAVDLPELDSLLARPVTLVSEERIGIVLFASPTCSLCKPVLAGASKLADVEPDLVLTVAVDANAEEGLGYLRGNGFTDGVAAAGLAMLDSGRRPYAVGVSADGVVLAAGAVNTLDQLEALVDLARQRSLDFADVAVAHNGGGGAGALVMERIASQQATERGGST